MTSPYHVIDFKQLARDLGDHYDPLMQDEYTASCPGCREQLRQDQNYCEICNVPVIWRNSACWSTLYGRAIDYERMLSIVPPSEPFGVELCRMAKQQGFANKTEAERWARAIAKIPKQEAARLLSLVARKRQQQPLHGRGLISYAINLFSKAAADIRTEPIGEPEKSQPSGLEEGDILLV